MILIGENNIDGNCFLPSNINIYSWMIGDSSLPILNSQSTTMHFQALRILIGDNIRVIDDDCFPLNNIRASSWITNDSISIFNYSSPIFSIEKERRLSISRVLNDFKAMLSKCDCSMLKGNHLISSNFNIL